MHIDGYGSVYTCTCMCQYDLTGTIQCSYYGSTETTKSYVLLPPPPLPTCFHVSLPPFPSLLCSPLLSPSHPPRIDHWDLEKERILVLTDNNIISVRYHFIRGVVEELKFIPLNAITDILFGDFKYTSSYV